MRQAADYFIRALDLYEGKRQFDEQMQFRNDRAKAQDDQFNQQMAFNQKKFDTANDQWQMSYDEGVRQFNDNMAHSKQQLAALTDYRNKSLAISSRQVGVQEGHLKMAQDQFAHLMEGVNLLSQQFGGAFTATAGGPNDPAQLMGGITGEPDENGNITFTTHDAQGNPTSNFTVPQHELPRFHQMVQDANENPQLGMEMVGSNLGYTMGEDGMLHFNPQKAMEQTMPQSMTTAQPAQPQQPKAPADVAPVGASHPRNPVSDDVPDDLKLAGIVGNVAENYGESAMVGLVNKFNEFRRDIFPKGTPTATTGSVSSDGVPTRLRGNGEVKLTETGHVETPDPAKQKVIQEGDSKGMKETGIPATQVKVIEEVQQDGFSTRGNAIKARAYAHLVLAGEATVQDLNNVLETGDPKYSKIDLAKMDMDKKFKMVDLRYKTLLLTKQLQKSGGKKASDKKDITLEYAKDVADTFYKGHVSTQGKYRDDEIEQKANKAALQIARTAQTIMLPLGDMSNGSRATLLSDALMYQEYMQRKYKGRDFATLTPGLLAASKRWTPDFMESDQGQLAMDTLMRDLITVADAGIDDGIAYLLLGDFTADDIYKKGYDPEPVMQLRQQLGVNQ